MRVAFRVDASQTIGTGHVRRCLSLAQALRDQGADIAFVCREMGFRLAILDAWDVRMLAAADQWTPTPHDPPHACWAGVSAERDAADTLTALADWNPDWVVIDSYAFDRRWHDAVRAETGCRIAVIDDLGDRALAADLLVDQNLSIDHRAKHAISSGLYGRLLAGPSVALLAPAYRNLLPRAPATTVGSIGIFMGGGDAGGHSIVALESCRQAGFQGPVEIVTARASPHLDALAEAAYRDGRASLTFDLPDLAEFFIRHDLQIGAGGSAAWERCRAGAPSVALATADNQMVVVDGLNNAGAAIALGRDWPYQLGAALDRLLGDAALRTRLSGAAARLVDGRGCDRVALAMTKAQLAVRPAAADDARVIFYWRNDDATRAISYDSSEIRLEDHLAWFERTIDRPASHRIFIGHVGATDVGVLRLDHVEGPDWDVSIFLDPGLTGLGLGKRLLRAAERQMRIAIDGDLRFCASTRPDNAASQAMFKSCGYRGEINFVKEIDRGVAGPQPSGSD